MHHVLTAAALAFVCAALCAPALRGRTWRPALAVIALVAADELVLAVPIGFGSWNWAGKICELGLGIAVALTLTRAEVGLVRPRPGAARDLARVLIPVLAVELVALWFLVPAYVPTAEDHAFQLVAPALSEELLYRGVLLALLDRAFPRRVRVIGADVGWGVVVSAVMFGLDHGVGFQGDYQLVINVDAMAIPMLGGFVLGWCRARTGSLRAPVLLHGAMNEVANLIALLHTAI